LLKIAGIVQGRQRSGVIEINKSLFGQPAAFDLFKDGFYKCFVVLRIKKPGHAMEAVIGKLGINNGIIKSYFREAYPAKADCISGQSCLDVIPPPGFISKFYYIIEGGIGLGNDPGQAFF
jgi:hypothetical protein